MAAARKVYGLYPVKKRDKIYGLQPVKFRGSNYECVWTLEPNPPHSRTLSPKPQISLIAAKSIVLGIALRMEFSIPSTSSTLLRVDVGSQEDVLTILRYPGLAFGRRRNSALMLFFANGYN